MSSTHEINESFKSCFVEFFRQKNIDSKKIFMSETSRHVLLEIKDMILSGKIDEAVVVAHNLLAAARENGNDY